MATKLLLSSVSVRRVLITDSSPSKVWVLSKATLMCVWKTRLWIFTKISANHSLIRENSRRCLGQIRTGTVMGGRINMWVTVARARKIIRRAPHGLFDDGVVIISTATGCWLFASGFFFLDYVGQSSFSDLGNTCRCSRVKSLWLSGKVRPPPPPPFPTSQCIYIFFQFLSSFMIQQSMVNNQLKNSVLHIAFIGKTCLTDLKL